VFGINREQNIATCTKERHKENTPFILVSTIEGKDTRARVCMYVCLYVCMYVCIYRQGTYNVTLRRVRAIIVAVEEQYHIF
jgi:hypothetical protein